VINIKKILVSVAALLVAALLLETSYGIWRHNAQVSFRLTIARPSGGDSECSPGTYGTVQEGINLLKNNVYNCMYNKMEKYKKQLNERIKELESLPFGGITQEQLSNEVQEYRNVDIQKFGTCINRYGSYINDLSEFYRNSSEQEKENVPDFWDQYDDLWDLRDQLWHKRDELYDAVDNLWSVGISKIDFNNRF